MMANSLALVADAGLNLSDVMTLLLAWGGMVMAKRGATSRHTFGFKKVTILVSLGSALFLYAAIGVILWEALGRLRVPAEVNGMAITVVAALGVMINTATAILFMSGRKDDLNIKGAFLHMAADAPVSAGVVMAGFAIVATGWNWLDPLISMAIALVVLVAGWGLLKGSIHLAMAGVPPHIDAEAVLDYLTGLPGVQCVHDLHIWAMSTTENVLTAHMVMPDGNDDDFSTPLPITCTNPSTSSMPPYKSNATTSTTPVGLEGWELVTVAGLAGHVAMQTSTLVPWVSPFSINSLVNLLKKMANQSS